MVIAQLTDTTIRMHAHLAEYVTPFSNALAMPDVTRTIDLATDAGRAMMDAIVTQQASIIAYANDFKLLMILTLAVTPLVFVIGTGSRSRAPAGPALAHAAD